MEFGADYVRILTDVTNIEMHMSSPTAWIGGGRMGPSPQAAESKGWKNIYFKYKKSYSAHIKIKLLSRIRK
jgi:hypothetical protein